MVAVEVDCRVPSTVVVITLGVVPSPPGLRVTVTTRWVVRVMMVSLISVDTVVRTWEGWPEPALAAVSKALETLLWILGTSETGQTTVVKTAVSVTTIWETPGIDEVTVAGLPSRPGQLVTVGAQEMMVLTAVVLTTRVVVAPPLVGLPVGVGVFTTGLVLVGVFVFVRRALLTLDSTLGTSETGQITEVRMEVSVTRTCEIPAWEVAFAMVPVAMVPLRPGQLVTVGAHEMIVFTEVVLMTTVVMAAPLVEVPVGRGVAPDPVPRAGWKFSTRPPVPTAGRSFSIKPPVPIATGFDFSVRPPVPMATGDEVLKTSAGFVVAAFELVEELELEMAAWLLLERRKLRKLTRGWASWWEYAAVAAVKTLRMVSNFILAAVCVVGFVLFDDGCLKSGRRW